MKTLTTILVLVCISANISAQNDSAKISERKFEPGAQTGFYFTSYMPGFNYYSYFTLRKGIHEFAFGPSGGHIPSFYPFDNKEITFRLNGIDLSYRILPCDAGKTFDFYFQLNYFQKWDGGITTKSISNYPDPPTTDRAKVNLVASQLLLEYGFDIKFFRHFYIGTSIGIGGI